MKTMLSSSADIKYIIILLYKTIIFFFQSLYFFIYFFFQYNFIEHTRVQLTFTKDNLQQNENYNLKLTITIMVWWLESV